MLFRFRVDPVVSGTRFGAVLAVGPVLAIAVAGMGAVQAPRPPVGAGPPSKLATVERRVEVMGTTLDVVIRTEDRAEGLAASEAALAEIRRVETLLTTWRTGGELDRVDRAPTGTAVSVSRELADLLALTFAWIPRTGGVFDPTVAPLARAWDLRGEGRIPAPAELAAARAATGAKNFRIDTGARQVTRLSAAAGIEEGAWGKGYGLERAAGTFDSARVPSALLDLGGQVLAVGVDAGGKPWRVAIAHPRERARTVAALGLVDLSASTSGDSERSRNVGGRRIGHILDPRTGEPAPDFGSVTVVAPSALVADILSTAFFVLGPERGLALSETLRGEGVENEALFLVERGAALDAVASPGMSRLVISTDPNTVHGLRTGRP